MATRWAAAGLVALLALAGCGSSSGKDAAGSGSRPRTSSGKPSEAPTTSTASTDAIPTPERLRAALLVVSDMPAGWAAGLGSMDESSDAQSSPTDDFVCPASKDKFPPEFTSDGDLSAPFNKGQFGPFVIEAVAAFKDAERIFSQTKGVLSSCAGTRWEQTDKDGAKTTFDLAEMSMPAHGDEQFAYRLSGTGEGAMMSIDLVFVREGKVVALVAGIGITSIFGGGQLDADEFTKVLDLGLGKLAKI